MAQLPKFKLTLNKREGRWELKTEKTNKLVKSFKTKADATKRGVLRRAVHNKGSVRIHKSNGRFDEERTYPRSADPRSKG